MSLLAPSHRRTLSDSRPSEMCASSFSSELFGNLIRRPRSTSPNTVLAHDMRWRSGVLGQMTRILHERSSAAAGYDSEDLSKRQRHMGKNTQSSPPPRRAWLAPCWAAHRNRRSAARTDGRGLRDGDRPDGRLVPDLTRDAFSILDNGKPQALTLFANDIQPITVVILLDRSGSMRANFGLVQKAAETVRRRHAPGGQGAHRQLLEPHPGGSARLHVGSRELLTHSPDRTAGGGADAALERRQRRHHGAAAPAGASRRAGVHRRHGRADELSDAQQLAEGRHEARGRRERDGVRHRPGRLEPRHPAGTAASGRRRSRWTRRRVGCGRRVPAWHGGGYRGGGGGGGYGRGGGGTSSGPDEGLPKIAAATGGGYFELTSTNDLASTFARVADELHHQYALGFTPDKLDDKMHKLERAGERRRANGTRTKALPRAQGHRGIGLSPGRVSARRPGETASSTPRPSAGR